MIIVVYRFHHLLLISPLHPLERAKGWHIQQQEDSIVAKINILTKYIVTPSYKIILGWEVHIFPGALIQKEGKDITQLANVTAQHERNRKLVLNNQM